MLSIRVHVKQVKHPTATPRQLLVRPILRPHLSFSICIPSQRSHSMHCRSSSAQKPTPYTYHLESDRWRHKSHLSTIKLISSSSTNTAPTCSFQLSRSTRVDSYSARVPNVLPNDGISKIRESHAEHEVQRRERSQGV